MLILAKEPVYEVVSPAGESTTKIKSLAPSLKTLEGKTICALWNKMFQGEVTFPKIEEVLSPATLCDLVERGLLPEEWGKSADPNQMVPILLPSSEFLIVVTGDPKRNRNTVYRNNNMQGFATSKKIKLPANWDKLMAEIKK
jgi:hypothetical protein